MHNSNIASLYIANEKVLTDNDLNPILTALRDGGFTTSDWRKLGVKLTIKHNDLKSIETDYSKVDQRLEECIVKWFKTGKATYTGLAKALEEMGDEAAADHIGTSEW